MLTRRQYALWARVTLGTLVGIVLVVSGLGLLGRTLGSAVSSERFEDALGVTGVMSGVVWFMIVVADRVCPMERRGWIDVIEGALMVGVLCGLGWSTRLYLVGAHG